MNTRENVIYFIKKNIFMVLVLISLCPVLALSYAKFTINSESYRSNEMYISELLYSIKIDNENTYTIDVEPGETEHTIEITSLNAVSTNYKLAYLNNDYIDVKYASDYLEPAYGGIITKKTIFLTIKNTSTEKQSLSLMVFGGYSFNDVEDVKILDTYTEILDDYWKYDYETTALYVDNTKVDKLDSSKKYKLTNYTCSNDAEVTYDSADSIINIKTYNQTKCSLYFEEISTLAEYLISNYSTLSLTKLSQTATGNQKYNSTEYRYQGKTPNNYITFNDEVGKWRIIGVFEVETPQSDGTYIKENKVKIVRDTMGGIAWNTTQKNDWATSSMKTLLNSGNYYNRTGTYISNGLTTEARSQISGTKWYLGNASYSNGYGNTKEIYAQERSTNVHSGNSQTWTGKLALIYPSDYMYASSGCYNDDTMKGHNGSDYSKDYRNATCTNTNWLFTGYWYFTLTPISYNTKTAVGVESSGIMYISNVDLTTGNTRPSAYLDANVKYISGSGTIEDPFTIK